MAQNTTIARSCAVIALLTVLLCAKPVDAIDRVLISDFEFDWPIAAACPPGDYERMFVVSKNGTIHIVNLITGDINADPFLDVSDLVTGANEQGLLGLAFHPDYADNGAFFIYYTDGVGDKTLSRFTVDPDDPDLADTDSETILLQAVDEGPNHNGGRIVFGPTDGYLYLGFGDGDDRDNGQDGSVLHGKVLRIDVNDVDSDTYAIPTDNPFVDDPDVLDEIYALGLRNPYVISIDSETGDLYIADVGTQTEEVNLVPGDSGGGHNFGWRCAIGDSCNGSDCSGCDPDDYIDPWSDYSHTSDQCAILGGGVYRGIALPDVDGAYFYSDWCSSQIFSLVEDSTGVERTDHTDEIGNTCERIHLTFDAAGEMYFMTRDCDALYRLVPDDLADRDCNENNIVDEVEIAVGLAEDCNSNGIPDSCDIADGTEEDLDGTGIPDECEISLFIRGDANQSGLLDIGDAITTLGILFLSEPSYCSDAIDVNDDAVLDVSDPIHILGVLFTDDATDPSPPYPDCGEDETDRLGCTGDSVPCD